MNRKLSAIFAAVVIAVSAAACSSEPDQKESESYKGTYAVMEYTWDNTQEDYKDALCVAYAVQDRDDVIEAFVGDEPADNYDGQAIIDFLDTNCD